MADTNTTTEDANKKKALKIVWRDPVSRRAFVYYVDADTAEILDNLDGYDLVEGGEGVTPPTDNKDPNEDKPTETTQEQRPVVGLPSGGEGEVFSPHVEGIGKVAIDSKGNFSVLSRTPENNFGFISQGMLRGGLLTGALALGGVPAGLVTFGAINANNTAAVNAARAASGKSPLSPAEIAKGMIFGIDRVVNVEEEMAAAKVAVEQQQKQAVTQPVQPAQPAPTTTQGQSSGTGRTATVASSSPFGTNLQGVYSSFAPTDGRTLSDRTSDVRGINWGNVKESSMSRALTDQEYAPSSRALGGYNSITNSTDLQPIGTEEMGVQSNNNTRGSSLGFGSAMVTGPSKNTGIPDTVASLNEQISDPSSAVAGRAALGLSHKDVVDTILGEAISPGVASKRGLSPEEARAATFADMQAIASVISNRSLSMGISPAQVVGLKSEFNASRSPAPGSNAYRDLAEKAIASVEQYGPTTTASFYATPDAMGNLPSGLQQVGSTLGHNYFSDPQNRSIYGLDEEGFRGLYTVDNSKISAPVSSPTGYYSLAAPEATVTSPAAMAALVDSATRGFGTTSSTPPSTTAPQDINPTSPAAMDALVASATRGFNSQPESKSYAPPSGMANLAREAEQRSMQDLNTYNITNPTDFISGVKSAALNAVADVVGKAIDRATAPAPEPSKGYFGGPVDMSPREAQEIGLNYGISLRDQIQNDRAPQIGSIRGLVPSIETVSNFGLTGAAKKAYDSVAPTLGLPQSQDFAKIGFTAAMEAVRAAADYISGNVAEKEAINSTQTVSSPFGVYSRGPTALAPASALGSSLFSGTNSFYGGGNYGGFVGGFSPGGYSFGSTANGLGTVDPGTGWSGGWADTGQGVYDSLGPGSAISYGGYYGNNVTPGTESNSGYAGSGTSTGGYSGNSNTGSNSSGTSGSKGDSGGFASGPAGNAGGSGTVGSNGMFGGGV